jgi:polysaccharide export outer membrane protein
MMKTLYALCLFVSLVAAAYAEDPTLHARTRYTLHPGDTVDLVLRFTPEYNQTLIVQPDGYVNVTPVGDVKIAGLTLENAHDAIVQKLLLRLNAPDLNLVLKDFQHPYVVVGGEVQLPGKIELRQDMTAMQAVILAGGFKSSARDTRIVVFRHIDSEMGEVKVLNLHKLQDRKDLERDMTLQAGDMILVPQNRVATFSRYMEATHFSSGLSPAVTP